jgi:calcium/calmodulin-dependent protein kinase I
MELKKSYIVTSELDKTNHSTIYLARRKRDDEPLVIKEIEKYPEANLEIEVKILRILQNHQKIVQLEKYYEDEEFIWIIMERLGFDLFNWTEEHGNFLEEDGKSIISSVIYAVHICHREGIIHRDIKLQNILSSTMQFENKSDVKLIDFGLAEIIKNKKLNKFVGTINYYAPEVKLEQEYDYSADMWSLGVVSYLLFSDYYPYKEEILTILPKNYKPRFNNPVWNNISDEVKNFISNCLKVDPSQRITSEQAIKLPFVQHNLRNDMKRLKQERNSIIENLAISMNNIKLLEDSLL